MYIKTLILKALMSWFSIYFQGNSENNYPKSMNTLFLSTDILMAEHSYFNDLF